MSPQPSETPVEVSDSERFLHPTEDCCLLFVFASLSGRVLKQDIVNDPEHIKYIHFLLGL